MIKNKLYNMLLLIALFNVFDILSMYTMPKKLDYELYQYIHENFARIPKHGINEKSEDHVKKLNYVETLLKKGASPDAPCGEKNETALIRSVETICITLVEALLPYVKNIDAQDHQEGCHSALTLAFLINFNKAVELLLIKGAQWNIKEKSDNKYYKELDSFFKATDTDKRVEIFRKNKNNNWFIVPMIQTLYVSEEKVSETVQVVLFWRWLNKEQQMLVEFALSRE
jgi:hypothetical protein